MHPPLSLVALRAFASVGEHGSMKRAAVALGVTPGAISQQVKLLEQRLGVTLLERRNREVRLTVEGRRLLEPLSAGFQQIEAAVGLLGAGGGWRRVLAVTTTPSFAAAWLVPRLGRFSRRHPEIEVRVEASPRLVDLHREDVDVALRHGAGDYPGLEATRLITPRLVCVGSPALLASGPPITQPADCLRFPLLQDRDRVSWRAWLLAHGVEGRQQQTRSGPSFESDLLLIRAAAAGQGLALVRDLYAGDELRAKHLVRALAAACPTDDAYFFVTRPEAARSGKVAAFRAWVFEEAMSSSSAASPSR